MVRPRPGVRGEAALNGSSAASKGSEPEKYHFVNGFQRGLELSGSTGLREEEFRKAAAGLGSSWSGPERRDCHGSPRCPGGGPVRERRHRRTGRRNSPVFGGRRGARNGHVRLRRRKGKRARESGRRGSRAALSGPAGMVAAMHGGAFKGRQPESLSREEWEDNSRRSSDARRSRRKEGVMPADSAGGTRSAADPRRGRAVCGTALAAWKSGRKS